jgi:hypothetical protein
MTYKGEFKLYMNDCTPNLLLNIIIVFLVVLSIMFAFFIFYFVISYLYFVFYLRRYNMTLWTWIRGERPSLNMNYFVKSGYFEIQKF